MKAKCAAFNFLRISAALAAGVLGQRAGQPSFAQAGRASEGDGLASLDPGRQCHAHQHGPVDAAHAVEGRVLDGGGGVFQLGALQQPLALAVTAGVDLALDQQSQALVEAQAQAVGLFLLLL